MPEDGEVVALTTEGLWQSITAEVAARFRHRLTIWGTGEKAAAAGKTADDAFVSATKMSTGKIHPTFSWGK